LNVVKLGLESLVKRTHMIISFGEWNAGFYFRTSFLLLQ
jgi:hypothetical protein